jgi:recombination protein RecA
MGQLDDLMGKGKQTNRVVSKLDQLAVAHKQAKGRGTIAVSSEFTPPEVLPTGIAQLDYDVLSIGGIALGRAIELAGETSAGKTTLALNIVREAIAAGLTCVIAENEGTFTEDYAARIGMPPGTYHVFKGYEDRMVKGVRTRTFLSGPQFLEEIFRLAELGYNLIVIDSLFGIEGESTSDARLVGAKMNTKMAGAQLVAMFAKLWKNGWAPLTPKNKGRKVVKGTDSGVTLITINHLKHAFDGYGNDVSGSRDIQFIYSQRLWLTRRGMSYEDLDESGNPIYTRVKITCQKTKLSPGGRFIELYLDNRTGVFTTDSKAIVDLAIRKKVITKSGSWYYPNPVMVDEFPIMDIDMKWHGADTFVSFCKQPECKPLYDYILRFSNAQRTRKTDTDSDDQE